MQHDNWDEFAREMGLLCEAFDRKRTKELDEAYWSALSKMSIQTFRRACQFSREKAGQEGMDRLPKPGRLWALAEEARRNEKPLREAPPQLRMSREQHLAYLRRAAIDIAKRETMPAFKGTISRNVPDYAQSSFDQKWKEWDATYGQELDDYWLPRAEQLMQQWSGSNAGQINVNEITRAFA